MRLDKFLSQNTRYSRSQIHKAIKSQRVSVDGALVSSIDLKLSGNEKIYLDNQLIEPIGTRYFMLHKPLGYVCANSDSENPIVLDLIAANHKQDLQIVGRLDKDTSGLLLLTNDGQWNHRVTAPKHEHVKTYLVTTANPITVETAELFLKGVQLHGEKHLTRPAKLVIIDSHNAKLSIQEGKYHQVKRMFAAVGNLVVGLHREAIGDIQLDHTLAVGAYRPLIPAEILSFT
jgi:16S rRNA pseudouridine516 synthase